MIKTCAICGELYKSGCCGVLCPPCYAAQCELYEREARHPRETTEEMQQWLLSEGFRFVRHDPRRDRDLWQRGEEERWVEITNERWELS